MDAFIEQLQREHKALRATLEQVYQLGIGTPEAQAKLQGVRQLLVHHLASEDTRLYPLLETLGDVEAKNTVARMKDDMAKITEAALGFFKQYESGGSGFAFARDFGHLMAVLGTRISQEEATLYPIYNRLALSAKS